MLNNSEIVDQIRECWIDILEVKPIHIQDDFFALGGNSLKATRMIVTVEKLFNIEIPLNIIKNLLTIAKMTAIVEDCLSNNRNSVIETGEI